jgi:hypothetical protein
MHAGDKGGRWGRFVRPVQRDLKSKVLTGDLGPVGESERPSLPTGPGA